MKRVMQFVCIIMLTASSIALGAQPWIPSQSFRDSVAIGKVIAADSKSVLDIVSTTKGMLIPRMTTVQRDAISSPTTGLLIWNTTTSALNQYNGSAWKQFASDGLTFTGNVVGAVTGNADTATALAANPPDCAADTYATTIAASGDLTCTTVTNAGLAGSIAASKLVGTDIATVGTITSGTWSGTAISTAKGGTGQDFSGSTGFIYDTAGTMSAKSAAQATALLDAVVGDSGAGGTKGLVPAPAAGDAAASKFLKANGSWAAPTISLTAPTYQIFNSGTDQTYTTPAGVIRLRITAIGGGGQGGGSGTAGGSAGSNGTATTFRRADEGVTYISAGGGNGGGVNGSGGGGGGTVTVTTFTEIAAKQGTQGGGYSYNANSTGFQAPGGAGGPSFLSGGGQGNGAAAGSAAIQNTGSGGAGGGTAWNVAAMYAGGGGGAGGYAIVEVSSSIAATYKYTVGAGGSAAGAAGTSGYAGGAGAAGKLIVEEFYQ